MIVPTVIVFFPFEPYILKVMVLQSATIFFRFKLLFDAFLSFVNRDISVFNVVIEFFIFSVTFYILWILLLPISRFILLL